MRLSLTFILILAACGPEKSEPGDESSDTGASTSTATGTGTPTGDDTGTGTPTGGDTGTGTSTDTPTTEEPLSCDAFMPPPPETLHEVTVAIVSKMSEPVWIGAVGCGGLPLVRILGADAVDLSDDPGDCHPVACHHFIGLEDCSFGCNNCGGAAAVRIEPGSTTSFKWSATRGVPMEMTAACAPGTDCQRECLRPEPVAAGSYSFELTAFRGCTGACDCEVPMPSTSCPLWEQVEMTDPMEIKVSLSYPEKDAVTLLLTDP